MAAPNYKYVSSWNTNIANPGSVVEGYVLILSFQHSENADLKSEYICLTKKQASDLHYAIGHWLTLIQ